LVLLGVGSLVLVVRTRGRIVIVWGERWPGGDDGPMIVRLGGPPHELAPPSPWEQELRRRLQRRLVALPPATRTPSAPASVVPAARPAPPLEAALLADGRYRLLPPPAPRQD
ncbi:MAG: hypothetical protein HY691_09440, partial [Chloroflexi bacterium]|nr:hypothetical protein [Chloroflexota bacterium]